MKEVMIIMNEWMGHDLKVGLSIKDSEQTHFYRHHAGPRYTPVSLAVPRQKSNHFTLR